MHGYTAQLAIATLAGLVLLAPGCSRQQSTAGTGELRPPSTAFKAIRVVDRSSECGEAARHLDRLYEAKNHCQRDDDCVLVTACDAANRSEDGGEILRLMRRIQNEMQCDFVSEQCRSPTPRCERGICITE